MRVLFIGVATLATLTTPSFAFFCSEPSAPYCVSSYGAFNDGYDFENCKRDVEQYGSQVEDYLDCLSQESQEVIDAYNDAIESFNRRARG